MQKNLVCLPYILHLEEQVIVV